MAPPFYVSSPTSRRIRRRQQKQRRRAHEAYAYIGLWTQPIQKVDRKQPEWLKAATPPCQNVSASPKPPKASKFEPQLSSGIGTTSNPFSLLDLPIPSPTLSVPFLPQVDATEPSSGTHHDVHGIGFSTDNGLLTPPAEIHMQRTMRRDDWASSLQRECIVTRSYDPMIQDLVLPKQPMASLPPAQDTDNLAANKATRMSAVEQQADIIRIPSPLLYHRRSQEGSSEPANEVSATQELPAHSFDKYNSTYTRLMSSIREAGQQNPTIREEKLPRSTFVAARLPLMGKALSSHDSEDGGVCLQDKDASNYSEPSSNSTASYAPPIVTTTNTYIFPKRVYHVYACQPPAWSGPSCSKSHSAWASDRNLVLPKLATPVRRFTRYAGAGSSRSSSQDLMMRPSQHRVYPNLTSTEHRLPASMPMLFHPKNRSSTQDSFDAQFNVGTAILTMDLPSPTSSTSPEAKDNGCEQLVNATTATTPVAIPTMADYQVVSRTATAGRDNQAQDNVEAEARPINKTVDWLFDDLDSRCYLSPEQEKPSPDFFSVAKAETPENKDVPTATKQEEEVWFDYHAPHGETESDCSSEIEIDATTAEADEDEWDWDNDEWESAPDTPATECDEQLSLFATEWE